MSALRLVVLLAFRSVLAHRVKSLVVGALLFGGTFVVVLGNALLDSIEEGMESLVTQSLAGHYQVKEAKTKDQLSLYGGFGLGSVDVGEIDRFEDVEKAFLEVEGVKAVVPEAVTNVTVFGRNEIDQVLVDMRDAVREGKPEVARQHARRARRIVDDLAAEAPGSEAVSDAETVRRTKEALEVAGAPGFWAAFDEGHTPDEAYAALDFLDGRIAPLASDGRLLYLRVIGTDPAAFTSTFPRFKLVRGEPIPEGKPGFLFNESTYQELVRNRAAAELDRLWRAVVKDGEVIADDPLLQQRIQRLSKQYRRITFQLDPDQAAALEADLRAYLPGTEGDLDALVRAFLLVDDATIDERHAWFDAHVAPRIPLYDPSVGSTVTLRGFTRSGYVKAIEVPIYGTFTFAGLEDAGLEQGSNLLDLVTFRELYGKMSDRDKDELAGIKAAVGVKELSRAEAEDALFGGGGAVEVAVEAPAAPVDVDLGKVAAVDPFARSYPVSELRTGLVLNAAIVLDDPSWAGRIRPALEAVAGPMGLEILDWREASGTLGQLVTVMRLVLSIAMGIIFTVALLIVNNAMVMATLDRVPEIGTLRAIGTRRSTVLGLLLLETAILGVVFGGAGAGGAAAVVTWLGRVGIPAPVKQLSVLFGGPRLYPSVGLDDLAFGLVTITIVALGSTLYPATMAARVPPIVAMRGSK